MNKTDKMPTFKRAAKLLLMREVKKYLEEPELTEWEVIFLTSVAKQDSCTDKQLDMIKRIAARLFWDGIKLFE